VSGRFQVTAVVFAAQDGAVIKNDNLGRLRPAAPGGRIINRFARASYRFGGAAARASGPYVAQKASHGGATATKCAQVPGAALASG
jgi:hypothetical protein